MITKAGRTTRVALLTCGAVLTVPLAPGTATAYETIAVKSSTVTPSTIIGGSGGTQTITLNRRAPAGGTYVWLYYDNIYRETTRGYVVVPEGRTSVTFPFRAAAPTTTRTATLHAQTSGTSLLPIATFTHKAADPATRAVTELRFNQTAAVTMTTLTGTVVLKNPAPAGGITVSLWSNTSYGTASVRVPFYVTVPEGRTTATFQAPAVNTGAPQFVRPSADLGTSIASREVIVVPETFALGGDAPRRNSTSKLPLGIGTAPNPSGTVVTLKSDSPHVQVPAQVTVPAGQPGVAIPYTMGDWTYDTPWPTVTATWNDQTTTATLYPQ